MRDRLPLDLNGPYRQTIEMLMRNRPLMQLLSELPSPDCTHGFTYVSALGPNGNPQWVDTTRDKTSVASDRNANRVRAKNRAIARRALVRLAANNLPLLVHTPGALLPPSIHKHLPEGAPTRVPEDHTPTPPAPKVVAPHLLAGKRTEYAHNERLRVLGLWHANADVARDAERRARIAVYQQRREQRASP